MGRPSFTKRRGRLQLTRSYQKNLESDTHPRIQVDAGVATAGMTHAQFCAGIADKLPSPFRATARNRDAWGLDLRFRPSQAVSPSRRGVCNAQGGSKTSPRASRPLRPSNNDNAYMNQVELQSPLLPGSVGAVLIRFDVRHGQIMYG